MLASQWARARFQITRPCKLWSGFNGCGFGLGLVSVLFCSRTIGKPLKGSKRESELIWLVFLKQQSSYWNEQQKGKNSKSEDDWMIITLVLNFRWVLGHVVAAETKISKCIDKRKSQRCLLWGEGRLPSFAPFFQWQSEQPHVNVLHNTGMETFMFHLLYKQRNVPGYIVESPNLFHGRWSSEWLSPDMFWKKGRLRVFWRKPHGHGHVMMLSVGHQGIKELILGSSIRERYWRIKTAVAH